MTKSKDDLTLDQAISVAASVAYTKKEISKLREELKTTEKLVEVVQGPPGTQGPAGPRGVMGQQGPQGLKGDTGERGPRGEQGPRGIPGEIGPIGETGPQGPKGDKGDTGEKGDKGDRGEVGPTGPQGLKGDRGDKGDKGDPGKNGLDGRDGPKGEMGPTGPAGKQGLQGERGPQGERGLQGIQGERGPQGIQGPEGPQGIQGPPGKDGDSKQVEQKFEKFKSVLENDLSQYKNKLNALISTSLANDAWKASGGGEVNLRYLDDVDIETLADGYVLSYNQSNNKFVFVEQASGGGTLDTIARTRANNAWSTANSAYIQANTATSLAQSAYDAANSVTGSLDTFARTTANSAWNTANTAAALAQAAYDQANTGGAGGGATESLNIVFPNLTGSEHKLVVLNNSAQTIPATALDVNHANRVVGILDANNEVVTFGAITNPSWNWTPEQSLYLGDNGEIVTTSTIDGATFSLKIGYAISATKAFIKIGTPVVL